MKNLNIYSVDFGSVTFTFDAIKSKRGNYFVPIILSTKLVGYANTPQPSFQKIFYESTFETYNDAVIFAIIQIFMSLKTIEGKNNFLDAVIAKLNFEEGVNFIDLAQQSFDKMKRLKAEETVLEMISIQGEISHQFLDSILKNEKIS